MTTTEDCIAAIERLLRRLKEGPPEPLPLPPGADVLAAAEYLEGLFPEGGTVSVEIRWRPNRPIGLRFSIHDDRCRLLAMANTLSGAVQKFENEISKRQLADTDDAAGQQPAEHRLETALPTPLPF